jgi:hypothetical protein
MKTSVDIKITGGNEKDQAKVMAAIALLDTVINSIEFHDAVVCHVWNDELTFSDNQGLSNNQIYDVLMSGQEVLNPDLDYTWNINLHLYTKRFSKAIGYTYPNVTWVKSNLRFLRSMSIAEIAGHIAHEHCHKLGFKHDFKKTKKRPFSVPYAIGNIVSTLADEFLKEI